MSWIGVGEVIEDRVLLKGKSSFGWKSILVVNGRGQQGII